MTISLSLAAMIFVAGPHTGASINPAVSIAQQILGESKLGTELGTAFWRVYMAGPICGSLFAGFISWAHRYFLLNYTKDGLVLNE